MNLSERQRECMYRIIVSMKRIVYQLRNIRIIMIYMYMTARVLYRIFFPGKGNIIIA